MKIKDLKNTHVITFENYGELQDVCSLLNSSGLLNKTVKCIEILKHVNVDSMIEVGLCVYMPWGADRSKVIFKDVPYFLNNGCKRVRASDIIKAEKDVDFKLGDIVRYRGTSNEYKILEISKVRGAVVNVATQNTITKRLANFSDFKDLTLVRRDTEPTTRVFQIGDIIKHEFIHGNGTIKDVILSGGKVEAVYIKFANGADLMTDKLEKITLVKAVEVAPVKPVSVTMVDGGVCMPSPLFNPPHLQAGFGNVLLSDEHIESVLAVSKSFNAFSVAIRAATGNGHKFEVNDIVKDRSGRIGKIVILEGEVAFIEFELTACINPERWNTQVLTPHILPTTLKVGDYVVGHAYKVVPVARKIKSIKAVYRGITETSENLLTFEGIHRSCFESEVQKMYPSTDEAGKPDYVTLDVVKARRQARKDARAARKDLCKPAAPFIDPFKDVKSGAYEAFEEGELVESEALGKGTVTESSNRSSPNVKAWFYSGSIMRYVYKGTVKKVPRQDPAPKFSTGQKVISSALNELGTVLEEKFVATNEIWYKVQFKRGVFTCKEEALKLVEKHVPEVGHRVKSRITKSEGTILRISGGENVTFSDVLDPTDLRYQKVCNLDRIRGEAFVDGERVGLVLMPYDL